MFVMNLSPSACWLFFLRKESKKKRRKKRKKQSEEKAPSCYNLISSPICIFLSILLFYFILKILFIYSWETHTERKSREREREREAETQAEGEAGSMQGARGRTWSWDPRITPWAEGRCSTTEPPRCSQLMNYLTLHLKLMMYILCVG